MAPLGKKSRRSKKTNFKNIQTRDIQDFKSEKTVQKILDDEKQYRVEAPAVEKVEVVHENSNETANDAAIALLMQYQYDEQHDQVIHNMKKQQDKFSKVTVSHDHMLMLPPRATYAFPDDVMEEEEEEDDPVIPACGYVHIDGEIVTKHDPKIAARKINSKMMNVLPCEVNMGDTDGFPLHMDHNVYNKLNTCISKQSKMKARKHDQSEKSTISAALDAKSSAEMVQLINAGALAELSGVVSSGKEAVVFGACTGQMENVEAYVPCAVKLFKTRILEFKTRGEYIRDDHRFKDRLSKTNAMTNLILWAEKEYRNLQRCSKHGLPCPKPFFKRRNIIAMSFIGKDNMEPAPQLKNIALSKQAWDIAYHQTLQIVDDLLHKCHLVHADLSEYNLLYHDEEVFVIDFAQSVDMMHEHAFSYLYRDLCTVSNFFKRKGVHGVKTGFELLESIAGISLKDHSNDERSNEEMVMATEETLARWRESGVYSDKMFEFLWHQSSIRDTILQKIKQEKNSEQLQLVNGHEDVEPWITKKTDSQVNMTKKKKKRLIKQEKRRAEVSAENNRCDPCEDLSQTAVYDVNESKADVVPDSICQSDLSNGIESDVIQNFGHLINLKNRDGNCNNF